MGSMAIWGYACRPVKQLLALFLARQPGEVAAAVRTTVAVTGVTTHPAAGNVLPSLATAQLNFRNLPGQRYSTHDRIQQASALRDEHAALDLVILLVISSRARQ